MFIVPVAMIAVAEVSGSHSLPWWCSLLRYLTQGEALAVDYKGDGPWKKCPLCFTLISVKVSGLPGSAP